MTALSEASNDTGLRQAYLAEIDLPGGVQRVWNGRWVLTTTDSRVWQPLDRWGKVERVTASSATVSDSFRIVLLNPYVQASDTDAADFATKLKADFRSAIRGRACSIWWQAFDPVTAAPIDPPQWEAGGRMGQPTVSGSRRMVSLSVEVSGLLSDGSTPPHGLVTSADQRARYATDGFFDWVGILEERARDWQW